jgi:hypothetical protein
MSMNVMTEETEAVLRILNALILRGPSFAVNVSKDLWAIKLLAVIHIQEHVLTEQYVTETPNALLEEDIRGISADVKLVLLVMDERVGSTVIWTVGLMLISDVLIRDAKRYVLQKLIKKGSK